MSKNKLAKRTGSTPQAERSSVSSPKSARRPARTTNKTNVLSASKAVVGNQHTEVVLLAVTGMSPAILTETLWALAHPPSGSLEEAILPHRVIAISTSTGRREIESQLFAPQPRFGGVSAWEAMRSALAQEGFDLSGRLQFGTTADDLRVFTTADSASGRTVELDDIRTPADNEAAASFILDQVRGLVEDPDRVVIASLAGGRKTMSALLYSCFSLVGRDTDRLTHVLVTEPYEQLREFFFPAQRGGDLQHRDGKSYNPAAARIELADVPFVPLRYLFRRELGRSAGGFMRLVESCRAGVRARAAEGLHLTVNRSRAEIEINGSRLHLPPREHLVLLFLAGRTKHGDPGFSMQKDALDGLNNLRTQLLGEARENDWSDWRYADTLRAALDEQDLRRALASLRDKIEAMGGDAAALVTCLPQRGRCSLDVSPQLITLKP